MKKKIKKETFRKPERVKKLNKEKNLIFLKKVYMEKPQKEKFRKEVNKPMNEEM